MSNISYAFLKLNKNIFYNPEGFTLYLSFSPSNTVYEVTNNNLNQGQTLDKVQSIYIDNSQSSTITTINVQKTGQNIVVAPNTILTIPILMAQNDLITFTNNATTNFFVTVILTDRNLPATNYSITGASDIYQEILSETQTIATNQLTTLNEIQTIATNQLAILNETQTIATNQLTTLNEIQTIATNQLAILNETQNIATNQLATLSGYKPSDIDTSTSTQYSGFIDYNGNWYIIKFDTTANTIRYAAGSASNSYATNWTNRTTLTYTYYNTAGIILQNQ
jgi:hypothetical protein